MWNGIVTSHPTFVIQHFETEYILVKNNFGTVQFVIAEHYCGQTTFTSWSAGFRLCPMQKLSLTSLFYIHTMSYPPLLLLLCYWLVVRMFNDIISVVEVIVLWGEHRILMWVSKDTEGDCRNLLNFYARDFAWGNWERPLTARLVFLTAVSLKTQVFWDVNYSVFWVITRRKVV